jgi:hypothetical protein
MRWGLHGLSLHKGSIHHEKKATPALYFRTTNQWRASRVMERDENVVTRESITHLYWLTAEHLQDYLDTDTMGVPEASIGEALDPPLLPESFGGDRFELLQHRLVQRIAIGFWQQASGTGFSRLREAVTAAERAAELGLIESDFVIGDTPSELTELTLPRLIPNSALTPAQVPDYTVTMLDPNGFNETGAGDSAKEWLEIWTFALTFNGYSYFGDDSNVVSRLGDFVRSIEQSFSDNGQLPISDLAMLRACLFFQQRMWCKWGGVMTPRCPPRTAAFLDALLRGIRGSL